MGSRVKTDGDSRSEDIVDLLPVTLLKGITTESFEQLGVGLNLLDLVDEGVEDVVRLVFGHLDGHLKVNLVEGVDVLNDLLRVLVRERSVIPLGLFLLEVIPAVPDLVTELVLLVEGFNLGNFHLLLDLKDLLVHSEGVDLLHGFVEELLQSAKFIKSGLPVSVLVKKVIGFKSLNKVVELLDLLSEFLSQLLKVALLVVLDDSHALRDELCFDGGHLGADSLDLGSQLGNLPVAMDLR